MAPASSVLPMDNQFTHEDSVSTAIEETTEEILSTNLSDKDYEIVKKAVESFTYTTTFLFALEQWYRKEFEDDASADMIGAFLRQFAKHEAKNI